MRGFFAELKRRKVYRLAVGYLVAGWLVIQIATQVFPPLDIPNWVIRVVIAAVAIGFPVALILSWAFDITWQGIVRTEDVDGTGPKRPDEIPSKSIAVLPFENLSDDEQNTYFADGIQDDILSTLTKVSDLKVISRTSVRQYRGTDRNLREIGRALGVAHILEGTVRRAGSRVRVNVQLINARTDAHVWSDTFDRELTDPFALQSEVAEKIADALRVKISPAEKQKLKRHSTKDPEAYDLFLRARDLFRWSGTGDPVENGEKALRLIDQAVARDPKFSQAYALASRLNGELYWFGHDRSRTRLTNAKTAAEIAVRLQPESGDARLAMAFYYYLGHRDYENARKEIELAQKANPNDAEVWDAGAALERRSGRWNDSFANFEKARYLDPRNFSVLANLTETLIAMRRYAEAKHCCDNALLINPDAHMFTLAGASIPLREKGETDRLRATLGEIPRDFDPGGSVSLIAIRTSLIERDHAEAARVLERLTHERLLDSGIGGTATMIDSYAFPRSWYVGLIARETGNVDLARRAFEAAARSVESDLRQWPDDVKAIMMLALLNAALGQKADAIREGRRAVEMLPIEKDAFDGPLLATNLAAIYSQVGEHDLAVDQLEQLIELPNGPTPGLLRIEPEWDSLRNHERFQKLL